MGAQKSTSKKDVTTSNSDIPHFKIILIGDCAVGKTCIVNRFIHNKFIFEYTPTLKCDISNLTIHTNVPYDTLVSLSIWDTPGKEDIDLRSKYYSNVDAVIVVCDLTNKDFEQKANQLRKDFFDIGKWTKHHYREVNGVQLDNPEYVSYKNVLPSESSSVEFDKCPLILLVGTKLDCIWKEDEDVEPDKTSEVPSLSSGKVKDLLDDVCKKSDFFAAIGVSSKWSDVSVHGTVQRLIRRLLIRNASDSAVVAQFEIENGGGKENLNRSEPKMTLFNICGIKEVDRLLAHAEKCYRHALRWRVVYGQNLSRLYVLCLDAGLNSVVGLRKLQSVDVPQPRESKNVDKASMDQLFTELFVQLSLNFGTTKLVTQSNGRLCIEIENVDMLEGLEAKLVEEELQWSQKQLLQCIVHHFNDQLTSTIQIIATDAPRLQIFFRNMDTAVRKAALNCKTARFEQSALVEKALMQLMTCAADVLELEKQVAALQKTVNVAMNN